MRSLDPGIQRCGLTMFYSEIPIAELLDVPQGQPRLLVVDDQPINIPAMHQIFADDSTLETHGLEVGA